MFKFILKIIILALLIPVVLVVLYKWMNPPITFIQQSQNELRGEKGEWTTLKDAPDVFEKAIIAAEDQLFFEHHGFDWEAIENAWDHNKTHKRKLGASTISQQTAKNVFLWESRTWLRKGLEVYFTFLMERIWSKERILEVYINVVEMGRGAFGIHEAARYYFNTAPQNLTYTQCVQIVSMLPCPRTCGINHRISRNRQRLIFKALNNYGIELKYKQE
ncbi:MAG: monofunctional biosynthetic peptidoglycan transglycosylase [Bacteroidia bacterium]|nr:monofunctional biosynthetic peptidoglycan transglycosylase [Bacteroidia bacterium]